MKSDLSKLDKFTKAKAKLMAGQYAPIWENAIRLFEDARVLRAARRYPSAAALAVLSLEELGKLILCHEAFANWIGRPVRHKNRNHYSHKQKQRAAAEALLGMVLCSDINAMLKSQGCEERALSMPVMADVIANIDEATFDAQIAHRVKFREHRKAIVNLLRGTFDPIKHAGLYFDVEPVGDSRRLVIDRKIADRLIRLASGAIHAAFQEFRSVYRARQWRAPSS